MHDNYILLPARLRQLQHEIPVINNAFISITWGPLTRLQEICYGSVYSLPIVVHIPLAFFYPLWCPHSPGSLN